jgi:phage terminase large subunit-like protein
VRRLCLGPAPTASSRMASPYYFDKTIARHAVEFFPRFLRLPSAEWYGQPFRLREDQAHHVGQIFGWRRRNGARRYRRVRWWENKGGGKSVLAAGIGHALTVGDDEPRAEVYCIARNLAQASIVYDHARVMVGLDIAADGAHGPLASLYQGSGKDALFCSHSLSSFQPLAGDPEGKHGFSPHGIIGDEVWEWRNGLLHRHLQKSTRSRRQPLDATFSAAGRVKTYAHDVFEDSRAILADPSLDPECYVVINGADPDDRNPEWDNLENLAKWNPGYPHSPKHDFLVEQLREAKRHPRLLNEFLQFHCGIWTEQATRWFPMHRWADNTRDPRDGGLWRKLDDELAGRRCRAGVDLASKQDIACVVYCFEPDTPNGRVTFLFRAFCNEATIAERDSPRTPYRRWVEEGALIATPGNVTDYDYIEEQIRRDAEKFALKTSDAGDKTEWDIAIDRFDGTQVATHLMDSGLKVALYGQEYANMNAPAQDVERLFIAGKLEHGNHPVARWMFGNAAYRKDHRGYIKPDKERAPEKIDLVVGAIMARGLVNRAGAEKRSVYESRGLLEVVIGEI